MFCLLKNRVQSLSLRTHILATLASFAAFQGTRITLDAFYAASGHPVDYATGQLAFSGEKIFGYYESMRAGGTFGTYIQTQMFDFLFIASVIAFGICLGTLIGRLGAERSATRIMATGAAFFAFVGGTLDALENAMSFVLMQFQTTIPQVLALIYSSFAALKFVSLTFAMALAIAALIAAAIAGGMHMFRASQSA
ncbi:MAG: hypothetical protein WBC85_15165 [Planktotalea sp.]|uniref:hypothetical protein n=1 Tax=Planktotalea sp. TaxID=2029877 RepID=UPI003C7500C9